MNKNYVRSAHWDENKIDSMMSRAEIESLKNEIYRHTDNGMFALAFADVRVLLKELKQWWAISECDDLEMRCIHMLKYNLGGVPDVGRSEFIGCLKSDIYTFVDTVIEAIAQINFTGYDYQQMRVAMLEHPMDNEAVLSLLKDDKAMTVYDDQILNVFQKLFRCVWLSKKITHEDESFLNLVLSDENLFLSARQLVVSALMLRALRCFDDVVFRLLLNNVSVSTPQVRARVVVSLVLLCSVYGDRLKVEKKITDLLQTSFDDNFLIKDIELAFRHIVRTFGTDEITRKITTEIYPEVMKSSSNIQKMMNDDKMNVFADDEINPKWSKVFDDSGIADKLREFTDMQLKGDDVYMGTFAGMKSFDFFHEITNWFMPFDIRRKDVAHRLSDDGDVLRLFLGMAPMCNSDKYSFFFSISQIPIANIKTMMSGIGGDVDALREDIDSEAWKKNSSRDLFADELRCYTQDLFRFYRLFSHRKDFVNPFECVADLADNKFLVNCLPQTTVKLICDCMFEVGLWNKCISLFEYLDLQNVWDIYFYQRMGYCYQRLSLWQKAIDCYEKADLLEPGDVWTISRKALCYRRLGNIRSALDCYELLLQEKDDDVVTIINFANACVDIGEYAKARAAYFKADYLCPDNIKIHRGLAWCLFLENDYDKSYAIYDKLIASHDVSAEDYLNFGHLSIAMNNKRAALQSYLKCRNILNNDARFAELLLNDEQYLKSFGFSSEDIVVLINQILMLSNVDLL